jgi:hypothetical protein
VIGSSRPSLPSRRVRSAARISSPKYGLRDAALRSSCETAIGIEEAGAGAALAARLCHLSRTMRKPSGRPSSRPGAAGGQWLGGRWRAKFKLRGSRTAVASFEPLAKWVHTNGLNHHPMMRTFLLSPSSGPNRFLHPALCCSFSLAACAANPPVPPSGGLPRGETRAATNG